MMTPKETAGIMCALKQGWPIEYFDLGFMGWFDVDKNIAVGKVLEVIKNGGIYRIKEEEL